MSQRFLVCTSLLFLSLLIGFSACMNPRKGYGPTMPGRVELDGEVKKIPFSHKTHAGVNDIPCRYCHVGNGEGPKSTIPGLNTCMNCHGAVSGKGEKLDLPSGDKTQRTQRDFIQHIRDAWRTGQPIKWVKVHDMPDHVQFSHQPHITAGVDCVECHGEVERMEVIQTQNAFNMGWCVNCHRDPDYNASVNCVTCHY